MFFIKIKTFINWKSKNNGKEKKIRGGGWESLVREGTLNRCHSSRACMYEETQKQQTWRWNRR